MTKVKQSQTKLDLIQISDKSQHISTMAPRLEEAIHQDFSFGDLYREFISAHVRINRQQTILAIKLRDKAIELGRTMEQYQLSDNDPVLFRKCLDLRHDIDVIQRRQAQFEDMQRDLCRSLHRLLLNVALNNPTYYVIRRD